MNLLFPITPATTGPIASPIRNATGSSPESPPGKRSRIARAASAIRSAWSSRGTGSPETAMYASPIVLIFSIPCSAAIRSSSEKISSRRSTSAAGEWRLERPEKSTMSANRTPTSGKPSAIGPTADFNRTAIGSGRMFRSSPSDRARSISAPRAWEKLARA